MKEFTKQQQQVYDLKESGKSDSDVSRILGIKSQGNVRNIYKACQKKVLSNAEEERCQWERRNPGVIAEVVEGLDDPFERLQALVNDLGLPKKVARTLIRRMEHIYIPTLMENQDLKTKHFQQLIDQNLYKVLLNLVDEVDLASAPLKDKAYTFDVLVKNRQLLAGEPTQIMSVQDREKLNRLLPKLVKEAGRRGITFEGECTTVG